MTEEEHKQVVVGVVVHFYKYSSKFSTDRYLQRKDEMAIAYVVSVNKGHASRHARSRNVVRVNGNGIRLPPLNRSTFAKGDTNEIRHFRSSNYR